VTTKSHKRLTRIASLLLLALGLLAPAAQADQELDPGSVEVEVLDKNGNPDNRAGIHPDLFVTRFHSKDSGETLSTREIAVDFPVGMGGDPNSVPPCPRAAFDGGSSILSGCPTTSQVGVFVIHTVSQVFNLPIHRLQPAPGEVTSFGAVLPPLTRFKFSGRLRPGDSGLTVKMEGLPQAGPVNFDPTLETKVEFWGVPADHQTGTSIPRRAFLTTPTRCDRGPLGIDVHMRMWERPNELFNGKADTAQSLFGCQSLPFAPTVHLSLENPVADTPTGIGIDMDFPEDPDPDKLASSQARSVSLELPAGMALSPGGASRLSVCSDAQLARGSAVEASCPASSKVGTVEIGMPQLSEPLAGKVYLGQEHPDDRFRLFVVASGSGTETKMVSSMRPDPATGRLTTVLNDLPEVSFRRLSMHFDGGPRGLLVTPAECGQATVTATFTPYSGTAPVHATDSVAVSPRPGQRCGAPAPFEPSLVAGTSALQGGHPTTFTTIVGRRDGEQLADRFDIAFPPGMSASLGSVDLCTDAQVAAKACPAASRIGSAFVDVGSGPETAELTGQAFLTGPYRGGPYGFALFFDAAIGPFHLGSLGVRAAMKLDPATGQVSVETDSIPQTFEGIPVRFQKLGLEIDRPGFMKMPTSCTPKRVVATVTSASGAVAHPVSEFTPRNCVALPFHPSFGLALTDRRELHRDGKPGLRISMRTRESDANLRSLQLLLPRALRFDSSPLREICARKQALKGNCPKGSQVGTGIGQTPLLKKPLKGSIYVVQPKENGEPDLWTNLRGQGIELNLQSRSATRHGRIDSSFEDLPDMPLSSFTMEFSSGKHGILFLKRGLCGKGRAAALSAPAKFEGHNGARLQSRIQVSVPDVCKAG
jgi:hypothetical protein